METTALQNASSSKLNFVVVTFVAFQVLAVAPGHKLSAQVVITIATVCGQTAAVKLGRERKSKCHRGCKHFTADEEILYSCGHRTCISIWQSREHFELLQNGQNHT